MNAPVKIGLIGAGNMGALHARTIFNNASTELVWVCDPQEKIGSVIATKYSSRYINEPDLAAVDAVVIAAPTQFHFDIGSEIISAGMPLLLEKPLANSLPEVKELIELSTKKGSPLMCGLLERFNPAVRTAFDLCRDPIHFKSVRHSPMTARIVTGVAGDLLIHDVDLALTLFGEMPVKTTGLTDSVDGSIEDIVEALLSFGAGQVASLSASRRSQRKVRSITIAEVERLIEIDLLRQDITIYKHVLESPTDDEVGYRQQTIIDIPVLRYHGEPLMLQLDHFVSLVNGRQDIDVERSRILGPHQVINDVLQ
jgi:predicted dehydrogenase